MGLLGDLRGGGLDNGSCGGKGGKRLGEWWRVGAMS